jgi:hypothetical protein
MGAGGLKFCLSAPADPMGPGASISRSVHVSKDEWEKRKRQARLQGSRTVGSKRLPSQCAHAPLLPLPCCLCASDPPQIPFLVNPLSCDRFVPAAAQRACRSACDCRVVCCRIPSSCLAAPGAGAASQLRALSCADCKLGDVPARVSVGARCVASTSSTPAGWRTRCGPTSSWSST